MATAKNEVFIGLWLENFYLVVGEAFGGGVYWGKMSKFLASAGLSGE